MEEKEKIGAFQASVARTPKEIRESRGEAIKEDGQVVFKRAVEDQEYILRKLKRERASLLDISPNNSLSFLIASEFDAKGFQKKDIQLSIQIRNEAIKLSVLKARYEYLFEGGEEPSDVPDFVPISKLD